MSLQSLKQSVMSATPKRTLEKVFTLANMDDLAHKIHKQVFIKKRMPKGKDIKLTSYEYNALRKWLETQTLNN